MPERRSDKFAIITANAAFDVIVVGGGINGIGTFRELSLQGLRVLLVEKNDYCSGCSAAPSRMIHGGLRYLENGEFDLVKESLRERDALLQNAPHMVRPLRTVVPLRTTFSGLLNGAANFFRLPSKPTERGALTVKIGLMLYDWVTRKRRRLPKHELKMIGDSLAQWPDLHPDTKYTATYYDAWISHPERLGLELLADTVDVNPDAIALNYSSIGINADGALELRDEESGVAQIVTAKAVVNATGAWVDQTAAALSKADAPPKRLVEGTKGSHLIIDHPELEKALQGSMVYYENYDGRICILFPYAGHVLVGSTDIRVSSPGRVRCEPEEKEYILQSLSHVFPNIKIEPGQIVFSYSGIRPLPTSDQSFTGRISRGHFIEKLEGDITQFCMVGGKWTTFRAFAEQVTDAVLDELGVPRKKDSLNMAIGGGRSYPEDVAAWVDEFCAKQTLTTSRAQHLLDHYGTSAEDVLEAARTFHHDQPVTADCAYTNGEIVHLAMAEQVEHLSDIIFRRTSLAISGAVSFEMVTKIADLLAAVFSWSDARQKREIANVVNELEKFHGVSLATLKERSVKGEKNAYQHKSTHEPHVH